MHRCPPYPDTPIFGLVVERERVGGREKERGKGWKEGGHSMIFTWTDATAYSRLAESDQISISLYYASATTNYLQTLQPHTESYNNNNNNNIPFQLDLVLVNF